MAHHRLFKGTDRELVNALGVTTAQLGALLFLTQNDGCLLKELSKGLMLNNSAITGLVTRMEKAELVKRKQSSSDMRAFTVHLTKKGKNIALKGLPMMDRIYQVLTDNFSDRELKSIMKFLNFINEEF